MSKQTVFWVIAYVGLLALIAAAFASIRQRPATPPGISGDVSVNNTTSNPVPVQDVGGQSKELVMLASQNGEALKRIFPDGTTPATAFDVPTGKALVVTDVNCSLYSQNTDLASATVVMGIRNLKNNNVTWGPEVVVTKPQGIPAASSTLSLGTGFVVSRQARLTIGTSAEKGARLNVKVMGYLVAAPQ